MQVARRNPQLLVLTFVVASFGDRGCSEIYHMPLVDYKNHKEGMPYELKFPFRPTTANNNNTKWPRTASSPQTRPAGTAGTLIKAPPPDFSNSAAIPRSVSSDGRPLHPKRYRVAPSRPPCGPSRTSSVDSLRFSLQIFARERQLRPGVLHHDGPHAAQHQLPFHPRLRRHRRLQPLEAEVHARRVGSRRPLSAHRAPEPPA